MPKTPKAKVIIGLVLAVLVVGGGVGYAILFPDPYRGWETYRDEKAGYSVKYPKGFVVVVNSSSSQYDIFGRKSLSYIDFREPELVLGRREISVSVFDAGSVVSSGQWVKEHPLVSVLTKDRTTRPVKIGDLDGVEILAGETDPFSITFLKVGDRVFEIDVLLNDKDPGGKGIYYRFLRSFVFAR